MRELQGLCLRFLVVMELEHIRYSDQGSNLWKGKIWAETWRTRRIKQLKSEGSRFLIEQTRGRKELRSHVSKWGSCVRGRGGQGRRSERRRGGITQPFALTVKELGCSNGITLMQGAVTEGFLSMGLTWSNYVLKIQEGEKFQSKGKRYTRQMIIEIAQYTINFYIR